MIKGNNWIGGLSRDVWYEMNDLSVVRPQAAAQLLAGAAEVNPAARLFGLLSQLKLHGL